MRFLKHRLDLCLYAIAMWFWAKGMILEYQKYEQLLATGGDFAEVIKSINHMYERYVAYMQAKHDRDVMILQYSIRG